MPEYEDEKKLFNKLSNEFNENFIRLQKEYLEQQAKRDREFQDAFNASLLPAIKQVRLKKDNHMKLSFFFCILSIIFLNGFYIIRSGVSTAYTIPQTILFTIIEYGCLGLAIILFYASLVSFYHALKDYFYSKKHFGRKG
jgi:hypothetical protein